MLRRTEATYDDAPKSVSFSLPSLFFGHIITLARALRAQHGAMPRLIERALLWHGLFRHFFHHVYNLMYVYAQPAPSF